MKGLILSGGRGSRLRPLTHTSAKQLVPIANKPILFYAIETLVAAGVTEIGIVVGDTGRDVRAAVGDGGAFSASITYIDQEAPLGLAHAVKVSQGFLGDDSFVMYLGDNLICEDLSAIVETFRRKGSDAMVLLARVPNVERLGVAELDGDRIVRIVEKPKVPPSDLAVVGVYLFSSKIFEAIDRIRPSARGELEITDAIQRMIDDSLHVDPHVISGAWKDTGRAEDLLEANRIVLDGLQPQMLGDIDDTVRLEGRVTVEAGARLRRCLIRGPVVIGRDTTIEDAYVGPYTSIHDSCTVRRSEIEQSIVLRDAVIDSVNGRISDSLIGRGCVVGARVGHPDAHRLVIGDHSIVELRA